MPQTPDTASSPYCTAADLLVYHDWQQVAMLVRDGDDALPDKTATAASAIVAAVLLAASGELESACLIGQRYTPADLAALTGASAARRSKLVADLAFWRLAQRKQPMSANPDAVPGAKEALAELDRLRNGERIFSFTESAEAGLPTVSDPAVTSLANPIVAESARYFGTHRTGHIRPTTRRGY